VILYEMAAGRVPFEGDTPFTIGVKHKSEIPKDPRELNEQIPDDLSIVIMRCLEKDKEKRYQSARELRSELENIEQGIPTTERIVPERKPLTSREITLQFSMRKLFIPALIVVAVVVIGLILWKFLPREKAVPSFPSDKPSLAVKYINVLPADRLFSIHKKLNLLDEKSYASEDLNNVAKEGKVNHIFQASFSKAGDIFRIDYTLQKGDTLEIIASDYVTGKSEESFPSLVDDITKKIKTNLQLSGWQVETDIDGSAGKITTSSPEAFKYYSIGRKFHAQAEYRKAIELIEQAVNIDPEYAMAYRAMAVAYYVLGYRTKAKELLQKSLEFKHRLSDRERYLIEADLYGRSEQTYDKSITAYEKLLEIYPDDTIARNNLALVYWDIGEFQKAIEHFEICINRYKTSMTVTYTNLAAAYRALEQYDKATAVYEGYLNSFSDNASIRRSSAITYRYQGKYDLAFEEMDKAFALAPTAWLNFRTKGDIYLYIGDMEKAEEEYLKLLEKEEPSANAWGTVRLGGLFRLQGRYRDSSEWYKKGIEQAEKLGEKGWVMNRTLILADMDVTLGRPEEALEKCETAWKSAVEEEHLNNQRRALNLKAFAYLKMKQTAEAQRTAEEHKELIEQGINKNHIRLYYHLMGRIDLAKGNYSKAIEFFNKGLPSVLPISGLRMIYADSMGFAFYKAGNFDKALEEYEKIDSLLGRIDYGDIYAKSFYMLGKIYEQQGETAKAIEHYEKFLSLWKNADPGIAKLEDAREKVAGLKR
jgi:tetratricopeptide (TPR) repeat protein